MNASSDVPAGTGSLVTDETGPASPPTTPTTRSMRARNRRQVLDLLREHGVLSQADIARKTGLSRTTISTVVAELRDLGLIVEAETGRPGTAQSGRPPVLISIDDSVGSAVGIDFGLEHIRVAVANLSHTVLAERSRELDVRRDAAACLELAATLVDEVLAEAAVDRARVIGVGMGLPGPIDRGRGMIASTSMLPGWRGVRAADEMSDRLGLPVEVDNDANLAALAELLWGAAQGCGHVVYVKAATGIGCGVIVDGHIDRGARGIAGEIGHTVVDESGLVCYCGSRGCLETIVGAPAIVDLLRRSHGEHLTLPAVLALAAQGDAGCQRALADAGHVLGGAVANVCTVLNPERVVVGGTLSLGGELVLRPLREAIQRATGQFTTEVAEVVPGVLGDRASLLGALALVLLEANTHFSWRLDASLQRPAAAPGGD